MADRRTIKSVSDDLNKLEIAHQGFDINVRLLTMDVVRNKEELSEIAAYFRWFMKVVIGLVATAVGSFIIQGGLV